ncbi:hypothetical protein TNIN_116251 [Trichonephila inaurata madagascariensis]|uniref:Uncharacterized protein n=1 Tax=Trichonephila inaurata madagascariensis TaxID=2747483 RepID=A0A8X7BQI5_9ARAC|nr:hypothetical protein TNIN_116251 [Trichonephila inaurata madagascariensis]
MNVSLSLNPGWNSFRAAVMADRNIMKSKGFLLQTKTPIIPTLEVSKWQRDAKGVTKYGFNEKKSLFSVECVASISAENYNDMTALITK